MDPEGLSCGKGGRRKNNLGRQSNIYRVMEICKWCHVLTHSGVATVDDLAKDKEEKE